MARTPLSGRVYRTLLFAASSKRERELFGRDAMEDYRELYEEARAEGKLGLVRLWAGWLLPDLVLLAAARISGCGVRRPSGFTVLSRLLCFVFAVEGAAIAATGLLSLALAFLYAFDRSARFGASPEMFQPSLVALNLLVGILCLVASRNVWRAMMRMRSEPNMAR